MDLREFYALETSASAYFRRLPAVWRLGMDLPGFYYSVSGAQAGGLDWLIVTIAYVSSGGLLYCRGSVGGCGVLFSGMLVIGITDP